MFTTASNRRGFILRAKKVTAQIKRNVAALSTPGFSDGPQDPIGFDPGSYLETITINGKIEGHGPVAAGAALIEIRALQKAVKDWYAAGGTKKIHWLGVDTTIVFRKFKWWEMGGEPGRYYYTLTVQEALGFTF